MSPIDIGISFQNEIRQFLISVGFRDVPPPQWKGSTEQFFLGGQEIDAFGRKGDFYVVVDAKTRTSLAKRGRNVRKHLSVINGYRKEVIEDIKRTYGEKHGYRETIFIFWTKDLKMKGEHKKRAEELKIALRDDFDLQYYNQALNILRNKEIVRNGFLKDISLQLPKLEVFVAGHSINAKAIRTKIATKTLYTFPIEVKNLLKFAYVFRVEMNNILGESYQRLLKERKIIKIRSYLEKESGYFPNNLIAVSEEELVFTEEEKEKGEHAHFVFGELRLPDKPCYLEILDGQHRLYSYATQSDKQNHVLWVTIVKGLTPVDRTKLFVTINKTQTPVPPSILWDLYQITEPESIRGRTSKFVYKLNEVEPLKDLISLPRVRSSRAYLSFPNFCYSLEARSRLFSRYGSQSRFKNVVKAYLGAISNDPQLRVDWNRSITEKGKKGFICTNNSISVLLRLLAKVLGKTGLPSDERVHSWKSNMNNWVITPLKEYLAENSVKDKTDPYRELRKLTSEKARKDAANEVWQKSPLSKPGAKVEY